MNMGPVLDKAVDSILERVHTAIPARIESYDRATRKCTAKPWVRLRLDSGPLVEIPPIPGVPVVFPSAAAFRLDFPLVAGDSVLLVFSEAALGAWLRSRSTGVTDPDSSARFSLTDAVAIPGLWPFRSVPDSSAFLEVSADGAIRMGTLQGTEVGVTAGGKVTAKNPSGDLGGLMDDLWAELGGLTGDLNTWVTATFPPPSATLPVLGGQIQALLPALLLRLASIQLKAAKVGLLLGE